MAIEKLRPTIAPNLPVANQEYSALFEDKYSNVLRLYFNQIDNLGQGLSLNDFILAARIDQLPIRSI